MQESSKSRPLSIYVRGNLHFYVNLANSLIAITIVGIPLSNEHTSFIKTLQMENCQGWTVQVAQDKYPNFQNKRSKLSQKSGLKRPTFV